MGKADLPMIVVTIVGDEQQVIRIPRRMFRGTGGWTLLERYAAQDSAQCDYG
jgi:hypothetical protein